MADIIDLSADDTLPPPPPKAGSSSDAPLDLDADSDPSEGSNPELEELQVQARCTPCAPIARHNSSRIWTLAGHRAEFSRRVHFNHT